MVLDPQRWLEIRRFRALFESGAVTLTEIAKETGLNRKTVRKYLSGQAPAAPPRRTSNGQPRKKAVDEVAPLIDAMLKAEILIKGAVVHERLVKDYGSTINYQRVKLYLHEARPGSPRTDRAPRRSRTPQRAPWGNGSKRLNSAPRPYAASGSVDGR